MQVALQDETIVSEWQRIVEIMAELMHVQSAIITRINPPMAEVLQASTNPDNPYHTGQRAELSGHYCEEVFATRQRLLVPDARASDRWRNAPEIGYGLVSYLGYPIAWPDGDVFGTICVLDNKENHYSPAYEALLDRFRALVEAHLRLLTQKQKLEDQLREIRTLRGIIPICAHCKKIRNDSGFWEQVEQYVSEHSEAEFSHGLCPACAEHYFPEQHKAAKRRGQAR